MTDDLREIRDIRLRREGQLATAQRRERSLRLELCGVRSSMNRELDPFDEVSEIDIEAVANDMKRLADLHASHADVLAEIVALRESLGDLSKT